MAAHCTACGSATAALTERHYRLGGLGWTWVTECSDKRACAQRQGVQLDAEIAAAVDALLAGEPGRAA